MSCRGDYRPPKEKQYALKLSYYVEDNGYEIVGDYIGEVGVELSIFDNNEKTCLSNSKHRSETEVMVDSIPTIDIMRKSEPK